MDPDETFRRLRNSKLMPNTQPEKDESLLFVQQMIQHFNNKESFVEIDPSGKSIAYMVFVDLDPDDKYRDIIFDVKLCLERINPTLFNEESLSESQEALEAYDDFVQIFVPANGFAGNLAPKVIPRTLGAKVAETPKPENSNNPNRVENSDENMKPPKISRTNDKVQKQLRF